MLFEGKNILVTGATGLIGYNLVCRLLNEGVSSLYATGRSIEKLSSTFEDYSEKKNLVLIAHDAATPLPAEIKEIDYIFHAAGPMERDIVMNHPVDVILPNINGTINCLELLRRQKAETGRIGRIVLFSSVTVYNNPTQEDYVATEDITNFAIPLDAPSSCYAESKRMTEVIAKAYVKQYGIDAVIARFSTVFGFTKNIPNTAFFEFVNKAILGQNIVLNGSGMPRRDNIYIDDAIDGLLTIALYGSIGDSYNISSNGEKGNFSAVDEIAELIAKVTSQFLETDPVDVIKPENDSNRKPGLLLSNLKLKSLGWSLRTSHEEGLRMTIDNLFESKLHN